MSLLPRCPKCYINTHVNSLGIDINIKQHRNNYRCESCKRDFQVSMGPEAKGDWLMTFWKNEKEFVALFRTWEGKIWVNQRCTSLSSDKVIYQSGLITPHIDTIRKENGKFRLTVITSLAETPEMEIHKIEFNTELKKQVQAKSISIISSELVGRTKTEICDYQQFLQELVNKQFTCAHPDAVLPPPPKPTPKRHRSQIRGVDLLSALLFGSAIIWLFACIFGMGFPEGFIYGLGIPLLIMVVLGSIFGGW